MQLEDIDLGALEPVPFELAWGAGNPALDRRFYRRGGLFYKVWGETFHPAHCVLVAGAWKRHAYADPRAGLAAIDVGFVDGETCPALVELIWDAGQRCRGYVMREGVQLSTFDEVDPAFVDLVCRRTLEIGYASTDFCPKNTVVVGGRTSLIDIDTVPTRLDALDVDMERERGCLRPHVFPAYREFILAHAA